MGTVQIGKKALLLEAMRRWASASYSRIDPSTVCCFGLIDGVRTCPKVTSSLQFVAESHLAIIGEIEFGMFPEIFKSVNCCTFQVICSVDFCVAICNGRPSYQ